MAEIPPTAIQNLAFLFSCIQHLSFKPPVLYITGLERVVHVLDRFRVVHPVELYSVMWGIYHHFNSWGHIQWGPNVWDHRSTFFKFLFCIFCHYIKLEETVLKPFSLCHNFVNLIKKCIFHFIFNHAQKSWISYFSFWSQIPDLVSEMQLKHIADEKQECVQCNSKTWHAMFLTELL